ncbi:hypothetical protein C2S53_007372 [Perilla frutescens var. hirtella]|uniref:Uncharacterized protein n=1 Tax=Perilla frutescens var. hirtella TaxID=608512 RepID=A0AAD4JPE6_PERFH|nr:hypothetical protein C2S53_007372 [Perilla frutescens var. hirtella]
MSDDHHSTNQEKSDQDAKKQENSGLNSGLEEIEEGYQTPTSAEHRIPPVDLDCPPPAPKRRKRLFSDTRTLRKVELRKDWLVEGELDSFFDMFVRKSTVAPPSRQPPPATEPEPDFSTPPKKKRSDE